MLRDSMRTITKKCEHCKQIFITEYKKRNQKFCSIKCSGLAHRKPRKKCPVCGSEVPLGNTTCSTGCANSFFRTGRNHPNWKPGELCTRERVYRKRCFSVHKKECAVCKYSNIVEVHHIDGDKTNNSFDNLIPLCPNHHREAHTKRFSKNIKKYIIEYLGLA